MDKIKKLLVVSIIGIASIVFANSNILSLGAGDTLKIGTVIADTVNVTNTITLRNVSRTDWPDTNSIYTNLSIRIDGVTNGAALGETAVQRAGDTNVIDLSGANHILIPASTYSNSPVTRQELNDGLESASILTLFGATNAHPVIAGFNSLVTEVPATQWSITTNLVAGTNVIGTFWLTNTTARIRNGTYIGRFYAVKNSGNSTVNGYMSLVYSDDNGATTNVIDTSAQSGAFGTSLASYRLVTDNPSDITNSTLYLGVTYFLVRSGGTAATVTTYGGDPYDTHLETPGIGNAVGYITSESDPVWASEKAGYVATNGSGAGLTGITAAQVGAATTAQMAEVQGHTSVWEQAATDASSATGAIVVIQSSTSKWNTASTDASSATGAITVIQASTSKWNTASTDASAATNWIATNVPATSGTFDHTALTNVNGDANEQHLTAAEKAIATNPPSTNGFISDASGWSGFIATQQVPWVASNLTGNLIVTGITDPDVTGPYSRSGESNGCPMWTDTNVFFHIYWNGDTNTGNGNYAIENNGNDRFYKSNGTNPIGSYFPVSPETGTAYVDWAYAFVTNTIGPDPANPSRFVIQQNGVVLMDATNVYRKDWGMVVSQQVASLNGSTASLNTAVGNLNGATQSLDAAVSVIATNYYSLPNGIASSNLAYTASTNAEAARVIATGAYPNANGVAASNLAYTASTNAEAARVISTNAQAVANAALPKAGGTMTGDINMGGLSVTNANNVEVTNAVYLPANGIVYFGTTTNYIQDQAGTNMLFKIGTNTINFGI